MKLNLVETKMYKTLQCPEPLQLSWVGVGGKTLLTFAKEEINSDVALRSGGLCFSSVELRGFWISILMPFHTLFFFALRGNYSAWILQFWLT